MRQIAPILTLSDALRIYFHELLSQEKKSVSWVKDVDGVGHLLMDTFCNSVSSYIAKEFAPLKQKDIIFTTLVYGISAYLCFSKIWHNNLFYAY